MSTTSWRDPDSNRHPPDMALVILALSHFPSVCPGHLARENFVLIAPASVFRVGFAGGRCQ